MILTRRHLLTAAAAATLVRPAQAQALPRILCFGDSLTAGFGLGPTRGLVPQLSAWLADAGRPADLIDAGLVGDTTYGGRVRIELSMRRHRPDAVMVELGGNDMLRRWQPADAEANLDAILQTAGSGGRALLLVGIHAPAGQPDWRRAWSGIWPRLAERHGALLLQDLYAPLAQVPATDRAPLLLRDGVHPSAQGVALIVRHLGPVAAQLVERAA
ncbi:GDSL-type esterase/lipase family protein [Paracoccus marcusii]|uniref:GDSL-type esterase/lipase family protein n=1 Tax=Paracoccus marcusii TaxID=59779 RepID=UPI002ED491A5|nr:GDSL-type esterase/lipase family protein [Paracoccus marcusii]